MEELKNLTFGFGRLEVWQKSIELSKDLYELTENFSKLDYSILSNQLRKIGVAISSNIAKSTVQQKNWEKANFSNMALTNVYEVVNLLDFSLAMGAINEQRLFELKLKLDTLAKMLSGLRKSQLEKISDTKSVG